MGASSATCVKAQIAAAVCLCAAALCPPAACPVADWPQWLGPDRSGVLPEGSLPDAWPAGGPEGTPADKEIGTALGHLMGNLQRQLQAREARFLTAAPGGRYDYARQTARHTKQTASKQDESVKVQKKILTAIEKTGEQRFMQLLVANFR